MFTLRGGLGGTLIEHIVLGGACYMETSACPSLIFIEMSSWKLLEAGLTCLSLSTRETGRCEKAQGKREGMMHIQQVRENCGEAGKFPKLLY